MTRAAYYFLLEMVVCGPLVFGNVMNMEDPFRASNDARSQIPAAEESFEPNSRAAVLLGTCLD